MTKYAYFDHTQPAPHHVLGWYDTDQENYPNLPSEADRLELTDVQWAARLQGHWAVSDGILIPYEPRVIFPGLRT